MQLIKIQFFCNVCWRWEFRWLSVSDQNADIGNMIQYSDEHRHSPKQLHDGQFFHILRVIEMRSNRIVNLEG